MAMRAARKRRAMSQAALAQELGRRFGIKMDGTAITRMERVVTGAEGARAIRLGEAVAISAILDISLDDFIEPGLDEQIRDARKRFEMARDQTIYAEMEMAKARQHLADLENAAARNAKLVELQGELSLLDEELVQCELRIREYESQMHPDLEPAKEAELYRMASNWRQQRDVIQSARRDALARLRESDIEI